MCKFCFKIPYKFHVSNEGKWIMQCILENYPQNLVRSISVLHPAYKQYFLCGNILLSTLSFISLRFSSHCCVVAGMECSSIIRSAVPCILIWLYDCLSPLWLKKRLVCSIMATSWLHCFYSGTISSISLILSSVHCAVIFWEYYTDKNSKCMHFLCNVMSSTHCMKHLLQVYSFCIVSMVS